MARQCLVSTIAQHPIDPVVVAGVHKNFCGLPRDFLVGRTSSREKYLEKIFKNFRFKESRDLP